MCSRCGERHPGPPTAYSSTAPARWYVLSDDERELSRLDGEMCMVETDEGREFFLRANVELPVVDSPEPLVFSTWVSVAGEAMSRLLKRWEHPDRDTDPAYPAAMANDLPGYPPTLGLEVEVQTGPAGDRSRAVVLPSDHQLAEDQWQGVTMSRVQGLAELLAHPIS